MPPAPPSNNVLRQALERYAANGNEADTVELLELFASRTCTVLFPVRVNVAKPHERPEYPTLLDAELGSVVNVYTTLKELPRQKGGIAVLTCTVADLMGDLLLGADVGVVFDAGSAHGVYFRFNGPMWVVHTVAHMRKKARSGLN
ncbi:MAG: SseB family protein [Flavobacteriales bacterium]